MDKCGFAHLECSSFFLVSKLENGECASGDILSVITSTSNQKYGIFLIFDNKFVHFIPMSRLKSIEKKLQPILLINNLFKRRKSF